MFYGGLVISVEGIDGCGKDTLIANMEQCLTEAGYQVEVITPLRDSFMGDVWYTHIMSGAHQVNPYSRLLASLSMMTDVFQRRIQPAMELGKVIILNRWVDSVAVYQGCVEQAGQEVVDAISNLTIGTLQPDLTLLLDVDASVSKTRLEASGKVLDVHESKGDQFFDDLRGAYHARYFNNKSRITLVDANQTAEEVADQVNAFVLQLAEKSAGNRLTNSKRVVTETVPGYGEAQVGELVDE